MANLLASAMDCPHSGVRCRPEMVIVRDNPEWQAMVPYLDELGIKTVVTEELMHWDARADELMDWLHPPSGDRSHSSNAFTSAMKRSVVDNAL